MPLPGLLPLIGGFGASMGSRALLSRLLPFLAQRASQMALPRVGAALSKPAITGPLTFGADIGAFIGTERLISSILGEEAAGGDTSGNFSALQQLPQPPISENDRNFLELLQRSQVQGTLPLALEETGINSGGLV
jgi:hypothetical protein